MPRILRQFGECIPRLCLVSRGCANVSNANRDVLLGIIYLCVRRERLVPLVLWYDWDWSGSEQEFRRSLELNPNDSVTHREYSHYLQVRKRFDEAKKRRS